MLIATKAPTKAAGVCAFWLALLLLGLPFLSSKVLAQPDSASVGLPAEKLPQLFSIGLGLQHGFIFAHSQDVQNTKGARPTGVELTLSWQRNDAPTWQLCNCYPRQGLLLAYYDYDVAVLGKSGTAAYFLEPAYRLGNRVLFSFKGAAGLSYLTNPFDSLRNPGNQSYSTRISAYLLVGTGMWWRVSEQWWLNPSVNYQHISNGGMKKPNKGINWPTAGIALSYQPQHRPFYTGARTEGKPWRGYAPRWDVSLFGNIRRGHDAEGNRRRFPMAGLAVLGSKQVGRISALTLGAEVYQDNELRNKLRLDSLDASPVKAGVMAGHEFLLGRFVFGQQLGVYVFDQTPFFDRIYHRWGLQYRLNRHIGLGFNLLAHRQVAEFVDFRLVYSWRKPGK